VLCFLVLVHFWYHCWLAGKCALLLQHVLQHVLHGVRHLTVMAVLVEFGGWLV